MFEVPRLPQVPAPGSFSECLIIVRAVALGVSIDMGSDTRGTGGNSQPAAPREGLPVFDGLRALPVDFPVLKRTLY